MQNNLIPCCWLQIATEMELEELAAVVSRRVFGRVRFVGKGEYIRDEFSAVYTEHDIFGTRFILAKDADQNRFYLECDSRELAKEMSVEEIRRSYVDLSMMIGFLLEKEDGLSINVIDRLPQK